MIAKWAFECEGKARPGDRPGMKGLHVWKRCHTDRTATCLKCGMVLNPQEADDCFRE